MDFTIEWGGKYSLSISGKACLGVTISRDNLFCSLGQAIEIAKLLLDVYGHHGLDSLDIIDDNTGEVHCTVKRGE